METREITAQMLQFIDESPTPFQAVDNIEKMLKEAGYTELRSQEEAVPGGKYYLKKNGSALIAFRLPETKIRGLRIVASHSDSPAFKVKENPEIAVEGHYVKLNTEKYGGMILNTWLDRPLSVAGRVILKEEGRLVSRSVNLKRDLLIIPNVAIHFNREVNKGIELNPQVDMLPLMSMNGDVKLSELCAEELGIKKEDILGSDLYVYNRDKGRFMGACEEFIGSPRLDDLQCAFSTLKGFLDAEECCKEAGREKESEYIPVYALFDNEEIGSGTKQGADSTFLEDAAEEIFDCYGLTKRQRSEILENSFLLSADNGHGVHPNHPEKSDATNRPVLNGGVVLKFQGSQKYTTDGYSAAVVRDICMEHEIPLQNFANRSDILGGSTLGNISTAHLSISSADIGLAQLAMHSAFETAGAYDTAYMAELVKWYFV